MSERLQALVIGCGKIGGTLNQSAADAAVMTHALAYSRHERFALAACVEPDDAARHEFMRRWSVPHGFRSLGEALSSGLTFDVASVASATNTHQEILRELIDAPVRAVLAEKPLGGDHAAALSLVEAYEKKKKPLLVCYLRRFDPAMEALRREIADGAWGTLQTASILYSRGIMNNGSHAADLLSFLTGNPDFRLKSVGRKFDDGVPGDPTVDAVASLGDATVHFLGADGRHFAIFEITLVFSKGVVALEQSGFVCRRRRLETAGILPGVLRAGEGKAEPTQLNVAFLRALDAMFNVIHSTGPAASTGRSALPAMEICGTIRDAAMKGER